MNDRQDNGESRDANPEPRHFLLPAVVLKLQHDQHNPRRHRKNGNRSAGFTGSGFHSQNRLEIAAGSGTNMKPVLSILRLALYQTYC